MVWGTGKDGLHNTKVYQLEEEKKLTERERERERGEGGRGGGGGGREEDSTEMVGKRSCANLSSEHLLQFQEQEDP